VKRCWSDVTNRILNRIAPPEVPVIARSGRIVQPRRAQPRGSLKPRALSIAMQILRSRRRSFRWRVLCVGSPRNSHSQAGKRGAILQKIPPPGIFRFHRFLLWNAYLSLNQGGMCCQRNGEGMRPINLTRHSKTKRGARVERAEAHVTRAPRFFAAFAEANCFV